MRERMRGLAVAAAGSAVYVAAQIVLLRMVIS
jgi:hypothetical protein